MTSRTSSPFEFRYRGRAERLRFTVPGILGGPMRDQRFRSFVKALVSFGKLKPCGDRGAILGLECHSNRLRLAGAPIIWHHAQQALTSAGVLPDPGRVQMGPCLIFGTTGRARTLVTIIYPEDTKP